MAQQKLPQVTVHEPRGILGTVLLENQREGQEKPVTVSLTCGECGLTWYVHAVPQRLARIKKPLKDILKGFLPVLERFGLTGVSCSGAVSHPPCGPGTACPAPRRRVPAVRADGGLC